MHLLLTQSGVVDDGSEAVDLGQSAGDIIFLSAADSELTALARAQDRLTSPTLSLRLANIMQLSHNMSVDIYLEQTVRHAKLVIVRLLGGESYWPYGLEQLSAWASEAKTKLVVLPGDGNPDPRLQSLTTIGKQDAALLWQYLIEAGPDNTLNFLKFCAYLLGNGDRPPSPVKLLSARLYWPGLTSPSIGALRKQWKSGCPVVALTFYRSLVEGGYLEPVDALISELQIQGLNPLPVYVKSLKDDLSVAILSELFSEEPPHLVLNATGFAVAAYGGKNNSNPLTHSGCPVLQIVFSGSSKDMWLDNPQGLSARDLAMNVVLPELDGRVLTRAVSFKDGSEFHDATQCRIVSYRCEPDRISFAADLAASWVRLKQTPAKEKRIAILLANYPNKDGRIGNGVGYDTPQSTINLLKALKANGYRVEDIPEDGTTLIHQLLKGPTNNLNKHAKTSNARLSIGDYRAHFSNLPEQLQDAVTARWGRPDEDPVHCNGAFRLAVKNFGNALVAIQPARGYNIDPKETYHDPALVPPHNYFAFYIWLREVYGVHAVVHNGKHGNLEWLPGKALALSPSCYPEAVLGSIPNIYPFIVNDPGEGSQAKRRTSAVIIDHLTPPLTRAETYGPLKELEALIDEYYLASGLDEGRLNLLGRNILELSQSAGLDVDSGTTDDDTETAALQKLDSYLCELKEAQIRDGLHVLGEAPSGDLETNLLAALTRVPRGDGEDSGKSLIRALSEDFGLADFDPLDCDLPANWTGDRPNALLRQSDEPWRTNGDTVERLEMLAVKLISNEEGAGSLPKSQTVLAFIDSHLRPTLRACGKSEIANTLAALDGQFIEPGPSGAPTRGRLDVLPTGRNFFSIDNRSVPTPTAWTLGQKSAALLIERYTQDHGRWPESFGLTAWGTSNMRTGGDDIAQAMALIGAQPKWDRSSWRVTGFDIIPVAKLGRPRVDVTLRISGFFRDAFPGQIDLFDSAVRMIGTLDEDEADNPIAAKIRAESERLQGQGQSKETAERNASFRVWGSKPGAYGAGLQTLIDEKLWDEREDLAASYINWGSYAYGSGKSGEQNEALFSTRLRSIEAIIHNQDNREHDILDSDDYYQFEGGMTAAVETVSGKKPTVYHNDHSRPERPVVRTLEEEIGRVVRSRVVNPKWIKGVMRHGYKGAFEIAATVDYLFAFSATTGAVKDHHFQLTFDAFIGDDKVREFINQSNPAGMIEISERFLEAIDRGLWTPKSNSAYFTLKQIVGNQRMTA